MNKEVNMTAEPNKGPIILGCVVFAIIALLTIPSPAFALENKVPVEYNEVESKDCIRIPAHLDTAEKLKADIDKAIPTYTKQGITFIENGITDGVYEDLAYIEEQDVYISRIGIEGLLCWIRHIQPPHKGA